MTEGFEGVPETNQRLPELILRLSKIKPEIDHGDNPEDFIRYLSAHTDYSILLKTFLEMYRKDHTSSTNNFSICPLFACIGNGIEEFKIAKALCVKHAQITLVDKAIPETTTTMFTAQFPNTRCFNRQTTHNPEYGLVQSLMDALQAQETYDAFIMLGAEYLFLNETFNTLLPQVLGQLLIPGSVVCIAPHTRIKPEDWNDFTIIYGNSDRMMIIAIYNPT